MRGQELCVQQIRTALCMGEFAKARALRTEALREIIRAAHAAETNADEEEFAESCCGGYGWVDVELMEILDNLGIPDE